MAKRFVRPYRRRNGTTGRIENVSGYAAHSSQPACPKGISVTAASAHDPLGPSNEDVRQTVANNARRVAQLGKWPDHVSPDSLTKRIPNNGEVGPGFDAGIACSLGMIPEGRQRLSAMLHAAYTPDAVAQVRREMGLDGNGQEPDPDSESTWWLAACSVCREGEIDENQFADQISEFEMLRTDPDARLAAARSALEDMLDAYEVRDGVPTAKRDGGMQGAYLDGHRYAAHYAESYGIWFVGTYEESLGVEDFDWEMPPNPDGRTKDEKLGRSGPVFGSRQFVKAASEREMKEVVAVAKGRLA